MKIGLGGPTVPRLGHEPVALGALPRGEAVPLLRRMLVIRTADLRLIGLTLVALESRKRALAGRGGLLRKLGAPVDVVEMARRDAPLFATAAPGADSVVESRGASPDHVDEVTRGKSPESERDRASLQRADVRP